MSISSEITRIRTDRDTIRTKLVELGLATGTADLSTCATAVDGIVDVGDVSVDVKEGETYKIPKGYHNGNGTVSGVAGGGNYKLQSKTATPSKKQQALTPDPGYYGLSDVKVLAIPGNYQDVSSVDATAADVLSPKVIVDSKGSQVAGTMPNNGAVKEKLTAADPSYTIPKGYHSGGGSVSITVEAGSATPTKAQQTIKPTSGSVLSQVVVAPIPAEYITTGDATAEAGDILAPETAYVGGVKLKGTMPNNGAISKTIDGMSASLSASIPAGYTSGGTVTLTNSVELALREI